MPQNSKPIPRSILIFGPAAHIGRPLAQFLTREAPEIKLRLSTSSAAKVAGLEKDFPAAEVAVANYEDVESLKAACRNMEGVFIITNAFTDQRVAMSNMVTALKASGSAIHIIKILGIQPEAQHRRIPKSLRESGIGLPVQHPIAKRILDDSELPVTYLNIGAAFIDNLLWMARGLQRERKLIWHDRLIPMIYPPDIGEVAGRLFLSDNHRHIGQFHTLNNGADLMRYSDVAALMSGVWGEAITSESSKEAFFEEYSAMGNMRQNFLWEFFEYEGENEVVWARNDFVERTLGRKPVSVRDWLVENREVLLRK